MPEHVTKRIEKAQATIDAEKEYRGYVGCLNSEEKRAYLFGVNMLKISDALSELMARVSLDWPGLEQQTDIENAVDAIAIRHGLDESDEFVAAKLSRQERQQRIRDRNNKRKQL